MVINSFRVHIDGTWNRFGGYLTGFVLVENGEILSQKTTILSLAGGSMDIEVQLNTPLALTDKIKRELHLFVNSQHLGLSATDQVTLQASFVSDISQRI